MTYIMYPNCMPDIMILACSQGCFPTQKMTKSEKGDNSVKYLQNFANFGLILYDKYHDPSSSGSPDILFTWSFMG